MPQRPYDLRVCRGEDHDFLWSLKNRTLRPYVEQTWGQWDDAVQKIWFEREFQPDRWKIITVDGRDAGLLDREHKSDGFFLRVIEILPQLQGRGIGSAVIRDLQAEAEAAGMPLELQVLKVNPAYRLYERLGFAMTGATQTHFLMRWSA